MDLKSIARWLRLKWHQWIEKTKNGLRLVHISMRIIGKHPSLLLFHVGFVVGIVGAIVLFVYLGLLLVSMKYQWGFLPSFLGPFLAALFFYTCAQIGLCFAVRDVFEGKDVSILKSLMQVLRHMFVILPWVLLSVTVGIIFALARDKKGGRATQVAGAVGQLAWKMAIFFIYPVLAFESLGMLDSVRRSAKLLQQTFGDVAGVTFGFAFITQLVMTPFVLLVCFVRYIPKEVQERILVPIFGVWIVFALISYVLVATAKLIFKVAAYRYANNQSLGLFDTRLIQASFEKKES